MSQVLNIIFDKEKSQIMKGVAIIAMIFHHCLFITDNYWWLVVCQSMKICVAFFCFIIGYAYMYSDNTFIGRMRRTFKLYVQYWIILLIIFIPLNFYGLDIENIAYNVVGIKHNLHYFNWFLYFYLFTMLIFPVLKIIIDRYKYFDTITIVFGCYAIKLLADQSLREDPGNIWIKALIECMVYLPMVGMGYAFNRYRIFDFIQDKYLKHHDWKVWVVFVITSVLMMKRVILGVYLDLIWAPIMIYCITYFLTRYKWTYLHNVLIEFGKMSMLMWFIHAIFFMPNGLNVFGWMVSWTHNMIPLYIPTVVLLSYIFAFVIDRLTKPLIKLI